MAAVNASDTTLECPVCHDDFEEPKILQCTHLVCKKCLLSWLDKKGHYAGCPLCREVILTSHQGQGDMNMADLVDALPTHLGISALVESQQVLSSPHVCHMCDNNAALAYCLQCDIKLCPACVRSHNRIPATKAHVIEDIKKLTVERLAETNRIQCKAHPDRLGELYCPAHQAVICILCIGTTHESCTGKKTISDVAEQKRAELKTRACLLRESEKALANEVCFYTYL
jgi:hypothetical protein